MPGTNSVHRSTTASTFVRTRASSAARSARHTGAHRREAGVVDEDVGREAARVPAAPGSSPRESASVRSAAMTSARTACAWASSSASAFSRSSRRATSVSPWPRRGQLAGDLRADARRGAGDDRGRVLLGGGQCHGQSVGDRARRDRSGRVDAVRSRRCEVCVTGRALTRAFANALFAWGSHGAGRGGYLSASERQPEHPPLPRVERSCRCNRQARPRRPIRRVENASPMSVSVAPPSSPLGVKSGV